MLWASGSQIETAQMRLTLTTDDDDFDRRPQRRRYEEPLPVQIRKQLLSIAESPLKRVEDEVQSLAKSISDNYDEVEVRMSFFDLVLQLVVEQPFKIPFLAAVIVVLNGLNRGEEAVAEVLARAATNVEHGVAQGNWREVKLLLKFIGGLQGVLVDEGVWPVLTELFERAVDLQTTSSDDVSFIRRILYWISANTRHQDTRHGAHKSNPFHDPLYYGLFFDRLP